MKLNVACYEERQHDWGRLHRSHLAILGQVNLKGLCIVFKPEGGHGE